MGEGGAAGNFETLRFTFYKFTNLSHPPPLPTTYKSQINLSLDCTTRQDRHTQACLCVWQIASIIIISSCADAAIRFVHYKLSSCHVGWKTKVFFIRFGVLFSLPAAAVGTTKKKQLPRRRPSFDMAKAATVASFCALRKSPWGEGREGGRR